MATLTIRDLPDEVRDKLRLRAAEHGRSMEAHVRSVLQSAVEVPAREDLSVRERVRRSRQLLAPFREALDGAVEELIAERREESRRESEAAERLGEPGERMAFGRGHRP